MVISVVKRFVFDAAHRIPKHPGKCKNLHGHTYFLDVGVSGDVDEAGMIFDFGDLKSVISPLIEKFDHAYLNDIYNNPTAEVMVGDIVMSLEYKLKSQYGLKLCLVRLWETPTSYAEWTA